MQMQKATNIFLSEILANLPHLMISFNYTLTNDIISFEHDIISFEQRPRLIGNGYIFRGEKIFKKCLASSRKWVYSKKEEFLE